MEFFKRLAGKLSAPSTREDKALWIAVRCDHCQETVRSRVHLHNDLSLQPGDGETPVTYFCRKVLIGSAGCYKPIDVALTFDSRRRLINKQVVGGQFVDPA